MRKRKYAEDESETGGSIVTDDKKKVKKADPKPKRPEQEFNTINRPQRKLLESVEYAKGGKVAKTGMAKVHKGEIIVPAAKAKTFTAMEKYHKQRMKKKGM